MRITHTVKTLGVYFNEYLLWNAHTEHLQGKLIRVVSILMKFRYLLPERTKLMLYHSLFESQVRYCALIWGSTAPTDIAQLLVLQNNAVRAIANTPLATPSLLCWQLIVYHAFIQLVQFQPFIAIQTTHWTSLLSDTAHPDTNTRHYSTGHHEYWHAPHPRTNYGLQTIRHELPSLLNRFELCHTSIHHIFHSSIEWFFY